MFATLHEYPTEHPSDDAEALGRQIGDRVEMTRHGCQIPVPAIPDYMQVHVVYWQDDRVLAWGSYPLTVGKGDVVNVPLEFA